MSGFSFMKRKQRVRSAIRKKSRGRLRLSVFKSNCHVYAQIIDDSKGVTLVTASTLEKEVREKIENNNYSNIDAAKVVGAVIAERAISKSIKEVVFDRGRYIYHGSVAALADSARQSGLVF